MLCSWRHWKLLGHACITTDCWTNCWVLIGQKLEMVTSFFEKVTYYTTATISTRKTLWGTRWPHHYMPLCSFSPPVPAHRECARPSKINPKWAKQKSNIKTHKAMTFQLVEYIWGTATFCRNSFLPDVWHPLCEIQTAASLIPSLFWNSHFHHIIPYLGIWTELYNWHQLKNRKTTQNICPVLG